MSKPSPLSDKSLAPVVADKTSAPESDSSHHQLRVRIRDNIRDPATYQDAMDSSEWRYIWRKISGVFEAAGTFVTGASAILAFSAGYFNSYMLSYLSGVSTTIVFVFRLYASFAQQKSQERERALNELLDSLQLSRMTDMSDDVPFQPPTISATGGGVAASGGIPIPGLNIPPSLTSTTTTTIKPNEESKIGHVGNIVPSFH